MRTVSLLIAYHKAPAGRAVDLPALLFGGEPLALVAELCKAYDKIIHFRHAIMKDGHTSGIISSRNKKNSRLEQFCA